MQIDTPEGVLTIDDSDLKFAPSDNGPELHVSLDPMPECKYERGLYGEGTLVIDGHTIVLRNDQATLVIEELRRPRATAKTRKTAADAAKTGSEEVASK